MKKWFLFIGLALFIGAFVGCKGPEGPTGPQGEPGPNHYKYFINDSSGSAAGHFHCYGFRLYPGDTLHYYFEVYSGGEIVASFIDSENYERVLNFENISVIDQCSGPWGGYCYYNDELDWYYIFLMLPSHCWYRMEVDLYCGSGSSKGKPEMKQENGIYKKE